MKNVRSKGDVLKKDIENRLGLTFFTFYDPDNNGLMVCDLK